MSYLIKPAGYKALLNLSQTEMGIKKIKDFFQQNKLLKGEVQIGDYTVDLKNITAPIMNIFAEQDHLVPPAASRALKGATSTADYTEFSFKGGHIGIYVSGKAQKTIPPAIGEWLTARS